LVRFWAFLGGVQKQDKRKCKKSMSKTFSKKILRTSTKVWMSVFPRPFLFYRVFMCFLAVGVQKHKKKRFTRNRQKNPNPIFSRLFSSRFWAFLGEGI
jgi:hypothetical protein